MEALFSLAGQTALVTGGAIHVGRGIAQALSAAGAQVAVAYHDHAAEAADLVAALQHAGGTARAMPLDVGDEASVQAAFAELDRAFGRLNILVNNAGIFSLAQQADLSAAEWDRVCRINLRGPFLCVRAALARMRGGAIINIASINALHPGFGLTAHYDATKGGLAAYTRSLAAELAPRGIRVNAIAPGLVDSPELRAGAAALAAQVTERTPLRKLAQPADIGAAAVFLASPAAAHITGEILVVDGGYLLT